MKKAFWGTPKDHLIEDITEWLENEIGESQFVELVIEVLNK